MDASEIKDTREKLGLNQVEFAQLSGVHPITVSKWERDEASPSAYQSALFEQFRKAASDPEVRKSLKRILMSAGVALAIAMLLKHLVRK